MWKWPKNTWSSGPRHGNWGSSLTYMFCTRKRRADDDRLQLQKGKFPVADGAFLWLFCIMLPLCEMDRCWMKSCIKIGKFLHIEIRHNFKPASNKLWKFSWNELNIKVVHKRAFEGDSVLFTPTVKAFIFLPKRWNRYFHIIQVVCSTDCIYVTSPHVL